MHFHYPLIELFRNTLGLGDGAFNFYKYSPQRECFVGFDQAFVKTELSEDELFDELKSSALNNGYSLSNFFIGLFLQYKVVKELTRRSRHTPSQIKSNPHYRVSLDTIKNANSGFSQHELLYNLNKNIGALVYYACPMIFDRSELYNPSVNFKLMRLANLTDCPSPYSDNENHFIYFKNPESVPIWCSEPTEGTVVTPEDMVRKIKGSIELDEFRESQLALIDELHEDTPSYFIEEGKTRLLNSVSDSLTILHYSEKKA